MFSLKEYREPSGRLPDYLPWALQVSETTVLQKDGILLRCWRYRGPDLAAASPHEQAALAERANAALSHLGSDWTVWVEMAQVLSPDYPEARFSHVAAQIADIEARSLFVDAKEVHESHYHLSLGWMTPTDRETTVADAFYTQDARAQSDEGLCGLEFEYFERTCNELAGVLSSVFLEFTALRDDDLLTYLKSCVSTKRQAVATPECPVYLDAYLPDEAITPGSITMLGEQCLAMFTVRGFPKRTPFAMLDALRHLGIEFRWMTRFIALGREQAERAIGRYQQGYFMGRKSLAKYGAEMLSGEESRLQNPISEEKADEATEALRLLGRGDISFGYLTSTFVVWDPDPDVVRRKADAVKKVVQDARLITIDETMNGFHAWLGTIPGHVHANVRRPLLHSRNLVRLMPLMSNYRGERENEHLKKISGVGAPHICCVSGTSRFDLNLAVGGVGHTLVIGPTGSGKTTLAGYLELAWLKYPGAKVIIYDVGGGARAATMAVGGAYYAPGARDGSTAFQPLRGIDDPAERAWAARWLIDALELRQVRCDDVVERAVEQVLDGMAADPDPRKRTLTQFVRVFGSHYRELGAALRIYTLEGAYGHIFDANHDSLGDSWWRCYEMRPLLGEEYRGALTPALKYLSHRDDALADGSPILKVNDETWRFWQDPTMVASSRSDVKTGRVRNIYNVYLTQEVADFAANAALKSAMLNNCKTHIYLPNENATTAEIAQQYASFGLTKTEIALLARATRQRDYFYRSSLGRRWFSLPVGPAALAFIGGSDPKDLAAMDAIVRERDPQDYALALLERSGVSWAVEAIKTRQVQYAE